MKVMAERLCCNAPNLTFMTNQLVARGLVERVVDPTDRRSRVLVLTAEGRRVRDEVLRATLEKTAAAHDPAGPRPPPALALRHDRLRAVVDQSSGRRTVERIRRRRPGAGSGIGSGRHCFVSVRRGVPAVRIVLGRGRWPDRPTRRC
jgi:DNA-binding MarR family transcriptional regulator